MTLSRQPNPLKSSPILNQDFQWSTPWWLFFENLVTTSSTFDSISTVRGVSASGSNAVIDSTLRNDANIAAYFYVIKNGTNIRGGLVMCVWDSSGNLASYPAQYDIVEIGTTTDQRFDFNYNSSAGTIELRSTSTNIYTINFVKIFI